MNLNFCRTEKIKLVADKTVNWVKVTLGAPISKVDGVGSIYTTGTDFAGVLSNKDIPRNFIEVEPIKVGFVYVVLCDNAQVGDLITPSDECKFVVSNTGVLKVTAVFDDNVVEAVGVAIATGGGGQGITYTAGKGIKIAGTNISIDEDVVATDTELADEVNKLNLKDTELEKKINDIDLTKEIKDRKDADTTLQNNIDTEKNERTAKDTELEGLIKRETTERKAEDTNINNKIDNLKKIYVYANGLEIKQNDLILHANKIYIANKDLTLVTWDVDEPNLTLTDSDTISCVSYEADITIYKGQIVIYNKGLYLCDATIDKTTTWDADKDKMISQQVAVDLKDYYTKVEANALLDNKENLLTTGNDIEIDKAGGNVIKVLSDTDANVNSIAKRDAEGQLKAKMPAVLENDTVINNEKLTTEINTLNTKDTALENKINKVETSYKQADANLETKITANTTNLTKEIQDRKNSDTALETKIDNLERAITISEDDYNQLVQDGALDDKITYLIESDNLAPTEAQYKDFLNVVYPVGSIYLSMNDNFIPDVVFGGVWEKVQTGRYLQATDTGAGDLIDESLPDIQGQQNEMLGRVNTKNATGAFETVTTPQAVLAGATTGAAAWGRADNFKASRYCSVYQDGAKVQPDSIKVIMWRRTA